jgi:hypothetical protein
MRYRIFAALYEETTAGWVWLATPRIAPHRLITLENEGSESHRIVYCEARSLDENFIALYNSKPHTKKIDPSKYGDVLVVGDWYRQALDISGTQTEADIDVVQQKNPIWPALRAGSQHPDPTVRLANRLGLLGAWLGLVGLEGAIKPFVDAAHQARHGDHQAAIWTGCFLISIIVATFVCGWSWRGVRSSKDSS